MLNTVLIVKEMAVNNKTKTQNPDTEQTICIHIFPSSVHREILDARAPQKQQAHLVSIFWFLNIILQ